MPPSRLVARTAWLALAAALTSVPALADEVDDARQHFAEGVRRFGDGDFEGARRLFLQAEHEHHAPAILYNLARAEERLGHPQAAVDAYERYLADAGSKAEYGEAAAIAIVEIRGRSSRVRIESRPSGARVFVDGSALAGVTPTVVLAPAGLHHVVIEADAWRAAIDFEAAAGGEKTVTIERPEGIAPAPPPQPPPAVQLEMHKNWLAAPSPLWPLVPLGAVAVAGVITSVVYALKVNADQNPADAARFKLDTLTGGQESCTSPVASLVPYCNAVKSTQDTVNTDNTLIVVGGVIAGAGALGAIFYYFLGPGKPEARVAQAPAVTPWLDAAVKGVSLAGRF
jgi:hypothetical protein